MTVGDWLVVAVMLGPIVVGLAFAVCAMAANRRSPRPPV